MTTFRIRMQNYYCCEVLVIINHQYPPHIAHGVFINETLQRTFLKYDLLTTVLLLYLFTQL